MASEYTCIKCGGDMRYVHAVKESKCPKCDKMFWKRLTMALERDVGVHA